MLEAAGRALSTTKARSRKIRTLISGDSTRVSNQTKPPAQPARPRCRARCARLSQPQVPACSKPSTDRPMPTRDQRGAAIVDPLVRRGESTCDLASRSTSATTATGTLIQKIDRQVHWVRKPPAIGPIAVSPPLTPKKRARARPRSADRERRHHDRQRGRHHQRRRDALGHPEHDQPGLRDARVGVAPHSADDDGEPDDAERHHPPTAEDVGQPAAQREGRGQGEQVGVDRPLVVPAAVSASSPGCSATAMATIVWSMKVIATAKSIALSATYRD